jgi:mannose-1-phosphate guanylyltransferase
VDAIILVGGQGLRLRPLTATRHKSMVPVCNRAAISYLFEWLGRSNIERVVLALGQQNEDLAEVYPAGRLGGLELVHAVERQRLESGGAIRNSVEVANIDDRFLVVNGDIYVDFDLRAAIDAHAAKEADLTLALATVEDPSAFGVAVLDEDGLVTGFVEKPPRESAPSKLVNAGVWIFERRIADEIPEGAVRVEETLFPSLVARRRPVLGYVFDGLWEDIGDPGRYLELNLALAAKRGGCVIDETVETAGTAVVEHAVIGPGTRIEAGASFRESVAWEDCRVGGGAAVVRSILADGVTIGEGATVEGAVVGRGGVVPVRAVVKPGTVIEPGAEYHDEHGR